MDSRKSLIDVGITQIKDKDVTYYIDENFGVKRGGSSLVYKVTTSSGRHLILKETYPYSLSNDIYRISKEDITKEQYKGCDIGDLVVKKNFLSDCDSQKLFERFKDLAIKESGNLRKYGQIYDGESYNKDDYVWNCAGDFKKHNTQYILIECTSSKTLDEVIDEFKYPLEKEELLKLLEYVKSLLNSLANLHKKNILHLDIAPSNAMVSNAELVRLIDFNSVFEIDNKNSDIKERPFSYREGFSALELRLRAKDKISNTKLTRATDTYSVGALIFYALFKRTPETIDKISPEIWENQLKKSLSLSFVLADVFNDISSVLKKALDNEPTKRYKCAEDMLKAVENIINKIKNESTLWQLFKEKLNTARAKKMTRAAIASILSVVFIIWSVFQITTPNRMLLQAKKFLQQNDTVAALKTTEEVYHNRKPWHFFYPEQEINSLARELYYNNIAFSVDFEQKVLKSVRKDNTVIAALENNIIAVKDIEHETTLHKYDINTQNGDFSGDCNYWASLDKGQLNIYELQYGKSGIVYSANDVINFSFSEDSKTLFMVYSNNNWSLVDFIAGRSINSGSLSYPCHSYENSYKLCDLNMAKESFGYVTDTGTVVIINYTNGIENGHIDTANASGIQFSQKQDATNIEVFLNNVGVVCFDYFYKTYCLGIYDHYNYFFDKITGVPYEFKNSYALINNGKTVISTSKRNPFSIMSIKFNENHSYKDSVLKALEKCDISFPYYYDYDYNNNVLYSTNLNNKLETQIDFPNQGIIQEVIVNEKDIVVFYENKIVFGEITSSGLNITDEMDLSDKEVYRIARNKSTFVLINSKRIDVYKYDKQWKYYGKISLMKPLVCCSIDDNGQTLVAQEKETLHLYWFDLKNLKMKDNKLIEYPIHEINANDSTAIIYGESGYVHTDLKRPRSVLNVIDLNSDEQLFMHQENKLTDITTKSVIISDFSKKKGVVTSTITGVVEGGASFTIKQNDDVLTKNARCNAIAFSDSEICFVERINSKDCLTMYDLIKKKKTILYENLITYNLPFLEPLIYEIYSPREGYVNISAQYIVPTTQNENNAGIATISSLYTHYTTEELLQLTRKEVSD